MKKGTVILLAAMILTVGMSFFLPSVIADAGDKKLLNHTQTIENVAELEQIGTENMTLEQRLKFINGDHILRSQATVDSADESEDYEKLVYTELANCTYSGIFYNFDDNLLLSDYYDNGSPEIYKNCYIDSESFQYVFTNSVVFYLEDFKLELEFDQDSDKLIAFYFNDFEMENLESVLDVICGTLAENWPNYLEIDAFSQESGENNSTDESDDSEVIYGYDAYEFEDWYYDSMNYIKEYGDMVESQIYIGYPNGMGYIYSMFEYDTRTGYYTIKWTPYFY